MNEDTKLIYLHTMKTECVVTPQKFRFAILFVIGKETDCTMRGFIIFDHRRRHCESVCGYLRTTSLLIKIKITNQEK